MTGAAFAYLHGFASGPGSSKARFLRERLAAAGAPVEVPDLNEGEGGFEGLTITRMLEAARAALRRAREASALEAGAPAVLVGSSLGGYVSALLAARERSVAAVVLLAPAFDFPRRLGARYPREQFAGGLEVFHHARGADARIGYSIIDDGLRYEAFPDVRCPALILHGARDEAVPVSLSERFVEGRPSARLIVLDDEHQLLGSTERIWEEMRGFLAPWL